MRAAFVREHTVLEPVPMVKDIVLYTATEIVPLWRATHAWLDARSLNVPFWCVPWAGGQALARYVLDHPEIVRGKRVLDFGTGSGLVAIAAAKAGASHVLATEVDAVAAAACALNASANEVVIEIVCEDLIDDPSRATAETIDVILAGDVWYELTASARFAKWFRSQARKGTRVLTGDPGRAYVPSGAKELAVYEVPTTVDLESTKSKRTRVLEIFSVSPED